MLRTATTSGRPLRLLLAFGLVAAGCVGQIGQGGNGGPGGTPGGTPSGGPGGTAAGEPTADDAEVLALATRRLSHDELLNTAADLVYVDRAAEAAKFSPFRTVALTADSRPRGYDNDARALQPSALLIGQYDAFAQNLARTYAKNVVAKLPCKPTGADRSCAKAFVESFGARAFRRPLLAEESAAFEELFWADGNTDFTVGVRVVMQAMLLSPDHLYRIELGREGDPGRLSPWETASRLSYFLWRTMPDDVLTAAAARNELDTPEQIQAQVARMAADPRAERAFVSFVSQWLRFDLLSAEDGKPEGWPGSAALLEEERRVAKDILYTRGGTLGELLLSRTTFVNAPLAQLYGVAAPGAADAWHEVELPAERAGFLTRGTFLSTFAHGAEPSPILRAVFLLDRFLCTDLGTPPPDANSAMLPPGAKPKTNREKVETLTRDPACQGCHTIINPLGFGLEEFDGAAKHRTMENGTAVNASGQLPGGTPFRGGVELATALASDARVPGCLTQNWVRYAAGGALDPELVATASERFTGDAQKLRALFVAIAEHPRFALTRFVPKGGTP